MLVPVERLIDGVVQTLTAAVAPDLRTPFARGQLWAAVDVLRNLRDRVEVRAALLEEEAASAEDALRRAAAALRDGAPGAPARPADAAAGDPTAAGNAGAAARHIEAALAAAPAGPPAARVAALREALVAALELCEALPVEVVRAPRAALAEHLGAQALRAVAPLKPSLLAEISRG